MIEYIKNNKALSIIIAISTLNLTFSFSLEGSVSKSYEETLKKIEVSEKRYLETIKNEFETASNIITSTEYVINDKNKEDIIESLLKTISEYESTMNSYDQVYIKAEETLLSAQSESQVKRLEKSVERVIKRREAFINENVDQYYNSYYELKNIFKIDIKNKPKKK